VTAGALGWLVLAVVLLAAGIAHGRYRRDMVLAEAVWRQIAGGEAGSGVYDPAMVADLPEPARRYFAHAIAPGTPIRLRAVIAMEGEFLLGTGPKARSLPMKAREVIAPPQGFVWMPRIGRFPSCCAGRTAISAARPGCGSGWRGCFRWCAGRAGRTSGGRRRRGR
jgi:hypothetical protein